MKPFFKPLPSYGMLGGFMSGPYIGSLKTLIFIFFSFIIIFSFKLGWVIPICFVAPSLIWALWDWNTPHGKIAKKVYYQKENLIMLRWIYTLNQHLKLYCKQHNLEYKQHFYRFWITQNGTTYVIYTFARIPWTSTVIGFEDKDSKEFFMKILTDISSGKNSLKNLSDS
jgi:hypothetical protein